MSDVDCLSDVASDFVLDSPDVSEPSEAVVARPAPPTSASSSLASLSDVEYQGENLADVAPAAPALNLGAREGLADAVVQRVLGWRNRYYLKRKIGRVHDATEATAKKTTRSLQAVAKFWGKAQLRKGDHLDVREKPLRAAAKRRHANQWTAAGTIELAFRSLGRGSMDRGLKTRRSVDAIAAVSLAYVHKQNEQLREFTLSLRAGAAKPAWICVQRGWDETPLEVSFGMLKDLVAPVARYWFPATKLKSARHGARAAKTSPDAAPSAWCRLSYDDYKDRPPHENADPPAPLRDRRLVRAGGRTGGRACVRAGGRTDGRWDGW